MGFENFYTVSGKWNVSRVVPRLSGRVDIYIFFLFEILVIVFDDFNII